MDFGGIDSPASATSRTCSTGVALMKNPASARPLSTASIAAVAASAGPLWPTKPSQLVSAHSAGPLCLETTPHKVEFMTLAGRPEVPFEIPPGSVLVITSARLLSFGAAAGTPENVQLVTFDASGNMGVLGGATIVTESNQQGHAELSFPTGVAVRPGSSICVVGPPRTTAVEVTGYFAKDR